jgi:eukaryotic-like serine/threonine-protein kinase
VDVGPDAEPWRDPDAAGRNDERVRGLLDDLVREHIERHGGDLDKSLAAARSKDAAAAEILADLLPDDPELMATISIGADTPRRTSGKPAGEAAARARLAGGRFRVLNLHAKGGLGQVMKAVDEELSRTVAVKEIQPTRADDPTSQERLLFEGEITGRLEHPSIVPVYGLGKYPDGRPYYAMRFIVGEDLYAAIKRFHASGGPKGDASRGNVELHQLLRRFIDLCNAIHYAHSRGVLHRDIKPGNVMLGKFGETLVVDWGLAKIVGRPDLLTGTDEPTLRPRSGSNSQRTTMGSAIGTPAYMSPEQAAGDLDKLGSASDVYSLGATLYCLLTGVPPFSGDTKSVLERIKKADFAWPRQVKAEIPRPLEAICLKGMALRPEDRYASASEMVAELERWMADEPVLAYRETRSERFARWMRRHRTRVQAGGAALLAAAVFFAVAAALVTRAWKHESAAREEAVALFGQAREAVDAWLTGAADALRYYPGTEKPRQHLLQRAAADYEQFTRRHSGDRDLEIERGRAYLRLGQVRQTLGDAPGATGAYESAAQLFDALKQTHPDHPTCAVESANCRTNQGVVLMLTGKTAAADAAFQASMAELNGLLERFPGHLLSREALATALSNRGELLQGTKDLDDAEGELRKCIDLLTGLQADEPLRWSHELSLISARDLLGRVLRDQGRYEEAVQEMRRAAELSSALADSVWDNPDCVDSRAATNVSLGTVLRELGDYAGEADAYGRAIDDYRALLNALPGVPQFEESLALTLTDLGSLQYKLGRAAEAEKHLGEARQTLHTLVGKYPQIAQYVAEGAYCQGTLARLLRDRGNSPEAKAMLEDAIEAFQGMLQPTRETPEYEVLKYVESLAMCQAHLGQTLCLLGQHDDANAACQEAVATLAGMEDKPPSCRDTLALVYECWGNALVDAGRHDEAARAFTQAAEAWAGLLASGAASADHRYHYARFLTRCPRTECRDGKKAVELAQRLTTQRPENALYWNALGAALYCEGDWNGSIRAAERAQERRAAGTNHGGDFLLLAMAKCRLNEREAATARLPARRPVARSDLAPQPGTAPITARGG